MSKAAEQEQFIDNEIGNINNGQAIIQNRILHQDSFEFGDANHDMQFDFDADKVVPQQLDIAFDQRDEIFGNDSGDDEVNHSGDQLLDKEMKDLQNQNDFDDFLNKE